MAVTKVYGKFLAKLCQAQFNWTNDTIKVALLSSTYTPNQDTHEFWSDVSSHEVSGTGYTAGGKAVTNKSLYYDADNNTQQLRCDSVSWENSTITARYAVVYKDTGTPSTSPLIAYVDFEQNLSSNNGTFQVTVPSDGLLKISTP